LPKEYIGKKYQKYVNKRTATMAGEQKGRLGELWKERQRIYPEMRSRGKSFVKSLEYVIKERIEEK